jgi:polysaccharide pyruvyl transferase WcaK-like protein
MLSPLKIPPSFYRLYAHTPFAHKSWVSRIKIPKIILGCGVNAKGPSELRTNVIKDLEQFDFIGLRDNVAVSILKSFPQLKSKVHLFYDLGFAIDTNGLSWKHSKNRAVVIPTDRFTRSDRGVTECEVAIKSREWLKEKLKPYEKTVFLAFGEQDNNDLETCETLAFYCTNKSEIIKASQHSLEEILNLIGDSQITLPYRLHGLILSFLTGTRYEFYPYHWKLQRVHDTIKGLDLEEIKQKQKAILEATGFFLQSK